jgi:hypothetical protein
VVPFFEVLEKDESVAEIVINYSISQTTLEEVFLNVSFVTSGTLSVHWYIKTLVVRTL